MTRNTPVTEERLKQILDERFSASESKMFDKLDKIIGDLETMREEQTVGYHQFKNLEERVGSYHNS